MGWWLACLVLQPLCEPGEARAWDRARDAGRLATEFAANELTAVDDPDEGAAIDWSFVVRETSFADIFCRREVAVPFAALRFRLRNLGEPFQLAIKVADAGGAEWTVPPRELPAGEWRTVDFALREFAVASWSTDPDGRLDFPLRYVTLIAFGIRPGPAYQLRFNGPELVPPETVDAAIGATGLPPRIEAGEGVTVGLEVTLERPLADDGVSGRGGALVLVSGGAVIATEPVEWETPPEQWPAGRPVRGTAVVATSRWRAGGACQAVLRLAGVRDARRAIAAGGGMVLGEVEVSTRQPGELVAKLEQRNGAPTIVVNGEPLDGMAWASYQPTPSVFADFAAAGVRLFSIMGTPTAHGYGLSVDTWLAPDVYDYSQLDERIAMVLNEQPEALIFPRLYLAAPAWWLDEHPDARVLYDPGDGNPVPFELNGKGVPSWSSPAWREAACDALRRLIAHVEAQPYADKVVGYHLASCCTEEWMYWGANEDQWTDYSVDNTNAFRAWLRAKYGTDAALSAAWGRAVTLDTATVPSKQERASSPAGLLRDPATDRPSIDYYHYLSGMVAESIDLLCGTVRQATRGEKLIGVFYGYLLQLFHQRQQNAGHLAFDAVVRSPNVDFLCSPTSYAFRQIGAGTPHIMAPLGSVIAHGKLWFDENDIRTSLAPGPVGSWGKPETIAGDLLQQDRELAMVLSQGLAQWWFDVGHNRYDDPTLMARLAKLRAIATETMRLDRSPVDQVAMVVDGRGLANLNVGDPFAEAMMLHQLPPLARLGAPAMHYELHDVDRLAGHRLILFAPLYEPTDAQLAAIERLKSDGRVLVFVHAPAPYRDGRWTPEQMRRVSGLGLTIGEGEQVPRVSVDGLEYGYGRPIRPAIVCDDPEAAVLGTLPDGSPGLVMRRFDDWTAVWSAAPTLPTPLLVRLAELAGVHRYLTTPDLVWASRELLAINVNESGERTIRLPAAARVYDYYAGELISQETAEFTAVFAGGGTKLYAVTPVAPPP